MTEWLDSVEEHRDTLEKLAERDLPLSDEASQLLEEYENERG